MRNQISFLPVAAIVAAVALPAGDAIAQPKLDDSIAALAPYVGHWEGQMDAYGNRPPGTVRLSCDPICGGSCLNVSVSFAPEGAPQSVNVENAVIALNNRTKSTHYWSFVKSAHAATDINIDGASLTIKSLTYSHEDGHESVRTIAWDLDEENQFTVRITNVRENRKAMPDWPLISLRRTP